MTERKFQKAVEALADKFESVDDAVVGQAFKKFIAEYLGDSMDHLNYGDIEDPSELDDYAGEQLARYAGDSINTAIDEIVNAMNAKKS